jgi:hypothetical protein
MVGVRVPLPDRVVLVREVHIPELVVDDDRFDFRGAAVVAEAPLLGATMAKMAPSRGRR